MLLILGFSVTILILYSGFTNYVYWGYRESLIHGYYGHFQLYQSGFRAENDEYSLGRLLSAGEYQKIKTVLRANRAVVGFVPRTVTVGLISNGDKTVNFFARGIDPEMELQFNSSFPLIAGVNLEQGDVNKVLLGKNLAAKLGLTVGKRATLISSTIYGSINALDVEVLGIFESGNKNIDVSGLVIPLPSLNNLLQTDGIQQIAVLLAKTEETNKVFADMQQKLRAKGLRTEGVTWDILADDYFKVVAMYDALFKFMISILGVICVLSITNTFIMSVFERVREIGTMMALGNQRNRIVALFVFEGLILGILGGGLGLLCGVVLAKLISLQGIYMPPPPGYSKGYIILISLVPSAMGYSFLLAVVSAFIASVFAAIKACRLKVVEALRYV
ncbi:ABC transporter permease [Candidatus Saganbacteria bacterium]|nr:ABC transporter permease [Candidatus Saganbacteria bacterium]